MRSDTAGYQHELLRLCEEVGSERFGRVEFAVGCDVTEEFKEAGGGARRGRYIGIWLCGSHLGSWSCLG